MWQMQCKKVGEVLGGVGGGLQADDHIFQGDPYNSSQSYEIKN